MTTTQPPACGKISELAPCPFCGAPAKLNRISGSYGYYSPAVQYQCSKCFCAAPAESTEEWQQGRGTFSVEAQALEKAAAAWSLRHPAPVADERAEGYCEMCGGTGAVGEKTDERIPNPVTGLLVGVTQIKRCPDCEGTGWVKYGGRNGNAKAQIFCHTCAGAGNTLRTNAADGKAYGDEQCPACGATGLVSSEQSVPAALSAQPSGALEREKCETCGGTGNAVVDYCSDCNGTGKRTPPERAPGGDALLGPVGHGVFLYNGRLLEVVHTDGDRAYQATLGGRYVVPLYIKPTECESLNAAYPSAPPQSSSPSATADATLRAALEKLRTNIDAGLLTALRNGGQLDMDGCEVRVSRQACEEAADHLEQLAALAGNEGEKL